MPPLVPLDIAICLALFALALGWFLGVCTMSARRHPLPQFNPPGRRDGEPQPYEWSPEIAEAHRRGK